MAKFKGYLFINKDKRGGGRSRRHSQVTSRQQFDNILDTKINIKHHETNLKFGTSGRVKSFSSGIW